MADAVEPPTASVTNAGIYLSPPERVVVPVAIKTWIVTDPNMELLQEKLDAKNWQSYGGYKYRVLKKVPITSTIEGGKSTTLYYAE